MKQPDLIISVDHAIANVAASRLCIAYGSARAQTIATALARATVELAVANWPGDVYLCAVPGVSQETCEQWAREFHAHVVIMPASEVTAHVYAEFARGTQRRGAAALLSCDVPHCRAETIESAYEHLAQGSDVIGRSEDGACYLVGLQQPHAPMFDDMVWCSTTSYIDAVDRAENAGFEFEELVPMRRVETPADLWLVSQMLPVLRVLI
jgi:glycosyltransferase A (GT-A) superfamily protein (DUF2064 family)